MQNFEVTLLYLVVIGRDVAFPCEKPAATTAPEWIIGPSFPTANPPATLKMTPMTFPTKVRKRINLGMLTPLR